MRTCVGDVSHIEEEHVILRVSQCAGQLDGVVHIGEGSTGNVSPARQESVDTRPVVEPQHTVAVHMWLYMRSITKLIP